MFENDEEMSETDNIDKIMPINIEKRNTKKKILMKKMMKMKMEQKKL